MFLFKVKFKTNFTSVIVFIFFLLLFKLNLNAEEFDNNKHVLILQSYHQGYMWTDNITQAIRNKIKEKAELHIEYMDTKRQYNDEYEQILYRMIKFRNEKFNYNLIIAVDNNAFDFVKKYRKEIFKDTPIVFVGINFLKKEDLTGIDNYTAINEKADFKETMEVISKIEPKRKKLLFITEKTTSGMKVIEEFKSVIPSFKNKFEKIEIIADITIQDLIKKLKQLPPDYVVLYVSFFRDKNEIFLDYKKSAELVVSASTVPVFCSWDFSMNSGAVGGYIVSSTEQGNLAGDMALKILEGSKAEDIPIVWKSPNQYIFDYNALVKWNIDRTKLPKDSIIINKPYSLYEAQKSKIIGIAVTFLVLIALIIFLIINITLRRKLQKELLNINIKLEERVLQRTNEANSAKIEAERANKAKSEFLANMSHEIRTPMNSIIGFSELLMESERNEDKKDQLKTIIDSSRNLLALINDILDFSKIESGKMDLSIVPFSPKELVEHISKIFLLKAEEKGLALKVNIEDSVPEKLLGDDIKINQILVNLIGNSMKFTQEGGIFLKISYENNNLILVIKDTGIGISPTQQEKIFKPFEQADGSVTRKYGGSGLGLVITSRFIEKMNGSINMQSTVGIGTTFTISLPLSISLDFRTEKENFIKYIRNGENKRIAVIDDSENDITYMKLLLSQNKYQPIILPNTDNISELVIKEEIDLILLDLNMKGLNGFEINRLLKKNTKTAHIPVIVWSGADNIEKMIYYGIVDYIKKPADQENILLHIQSALTASDSDKGIKNIFVIDDDKPLLKLYSAYLRKAGYTTSLFSDAKKALEAIRNGFLPDFIILDLMMPEIDGFTFLKELNKIDPEKIMPIIVVTAKDLTKEEIIFLEKETLKVFQKGDQTEIKFIDFLREYFSHIIKKGEKMVQKWINSMDDEILVPLLKETIMDIPDMIKSLEETVLERNIKAINRASHTLKGVTLNYKMTELGNIAANIQKLTTNTNIYNPEITTLFIRLKDIINLIPDKYFKEETEENEESHVNDKRTNLKDISILVAEDTIPNQKLIKAYLKAEGLTCDFAENGQITLEMLDTKKYDILFLDIQMPILDGMGVLKELKKSPEKYKNLYVVALTANALKGDEKKYIDAGCNAYLSKPVKKETIIATIEKSLKKQNW